MDKNSIEKLNSLLGKKIRIDFAGKDSFIGILNYRNGEFDMEGCDYINRIDESENHHIDCRLIFSKSKENVIDSVYEIK